MISIQYMVRLVTESYEEKANCAEFRGSYYTVLPAHSAIFFVGPPVCPVRGAQSVPERVPRAGQQVRREREDHQEALRQVRERDCRTRIEMQT